MDGNDLVVHSNLETIPFIFTERVNYMDKYPSNSDKSRETSLSIPNKSPARKEVDRTISGNASLESKTSRAGMLGLLFEQDLADAKYTIIDTIIKPKLKDTFFGIVEAGLKVISDGFQTLIYKDIDQDRGYNSKPKSSTPTASYYNYSSISSKRKESSIGNLRTNSVNLYEYDNIEFDDEASAMEMIHDMEEEIDHYGCVSVSQMYMFANITPPRSTDFNWGWFDLNGYRIKNEEREEIYTDASGRKTKQWVTKYKILFPRARPLPENNVT